MVYRLKIEELEGIVGVGSGEGEAGKGVGPAWEGHGMLRRCEHLAGRGPYSKARSRPPLVCIGRARHKAQEPRVAGKEGSVVSWTNSIFEVRSKAKPCFVTSSLCMISM